MHLDNTNLSRSEADSLLNVITPNTTLEEIYLEKIKLYSRKKDINDKEIKNDNNDNDIEDDDQFIYKAFLNKESLKILNLQSCQICI